MVSHLLVPENQIKGQGLGQEWHSLTQQHLKQVQELSAAEMTELNLPITKHHQTVRSQVNMTKKNIHVFSPLAVSSHADIFVSYMPAFIPMEWRWTEFSLWCSQDWKITFEKLNNKLSFQSQNPCYSGESTNPTVNKFTGTTFWWKLLTVERNWETDWFWRDNLQMIF